jgi:hypothetical protein
MAATLVEFVLGFGFLLWHETTRAASPRPFFFFDDE